MIGKPVHEWGPWDRKYNIFGEAMSYAVRRCVDRECHASESAYMPSTHQLLAMTKGDYRRWQKGNFHG